VQLRLSGVIREGSIRAFGEDLFACVKNRIPISRFALSVYMGQWLSEKSLDFIK
jgi:hypothetical protein